MINAYLAPFFQNSMLFSTRHRNLPFISLAANKRKKYHKHFEKQIHNVYKTKKIANNE